jgi:DNA-binding phage protein
MSEGDFLDDRKRASVEDYFLRKDRELVEKMRNAAAADRAKSEMSAKTGLSDPALLKELEALGFTPETISVLPLVPVVEMAWAEGGITPAERTLLVTLARARGIAEGSPADRQLSDWMARQPSPDVFARATRLIRAMLDTGLSEGGKLTADDLIKYSESIAAASGGILGIGKISSDERATLARIVTALKARG